MLKITQNNLKVFNNLDKNLLENSFIFEKIKENKYNFLVNLNLDFVSLYSDYKETFMYNKYINNEKN